MEERPYLSPGLPEEELQKLSRSLSFTKITSIGELTGQETDKSLERGIDAIHLTKCDDEEFIKKAHTHCSRFLRGAWAKVSICDFSVKYLSGGLTNYLYLCSLPETAEVTDEEPREVLVRIYGEFLDNKAKFYEGVVFTLLSERGYGPKTYGVFPSGRIEEFIPYRHLYTRELADPLISRKIAEKAAHYHSMRLPLNKEPTWLWENIERLLTLVAVAKFPDGKEKDALCALNRQWNLADEYEWMRSMLMELNSTVVFCHNDLQEGNILYIAENDQVDVAVIDYEYSSYNYRGFDIGNHFCEWMYEYKGEFVGGFKVYEDGYPSEDQQRIFAESYVGNIIQMEKQSREQRDPSLLRGIHVPSVDEVLHEGNRFALASHLFWALWSVVQAQVSKIDFDFMGYAVARMNAYKTQKEALGYR